MFAEPKSASYVTEVEVGCAGKTSNRQIEKI